MSEKALKAKKNPSREVAPVLDADDLVYETETKTSPFKRFRKWFASLEYSYLIYAFIIPVVLNYLIYLSMEIHPFGDGSVLVLDLNGQYVYFYEALRNAVNGETSLLYSFARALGGEFMGIYAYYVASPFSYIVCLFPQERILEALLCIFLLKTGLTGVTMGYYLHRITSKVNKVHVVTFSILYALCAYAVVQQHNSMWIDALMWLPLLTLGIEQLIKNYKYKLFVIMLALTLMSNFYIGYMVCIYTIIYFFCYYFAHNEKGANNPQNEPHHFRRSFLRIAGFSALGVGIAFFIVFSAYYSLQFGKNTFSNPNFSLSIRFDLMDLFTKFLPASYDTVRPEGLPFVYCGVLTLFCVPVYFLSKKFSTREKVLSAVMIFIFVLSFSVNTLDMIWHGFQKPNWLNYRYSFMLSFILIVLGYKGYGEIRKASGKWIASIAAFFVLFLAVAEKMTYKSYANRVSGSTTFDQPLEKLETIWFSLLCFIVFGVLLCIAIRTKHRENLSLIICIIVCLELFCNGLCCCLQLGDDVIYSSYSSYNNFIRTLRPLTTEIAERDEDFYRFEKNVYRKYCDNMALNIRGLSNSTSTLNKETIVFLANMGYSSKSHWSEYHGGNPVSDSLLGIRYIIGNEDQWLDLYYDRTDMSEITYSGKNYRAYYNKYALSIAYAVDDSLRDVDMDTYSSPMFRLNDMIGSMTGSGSSAEVFKTIDYDVSLSNCVEGTQGAYYKYYPEVAGSDCKVLYTFTAVQDGEVFFFLPCDIYGREVNLAISGMINGKYYNSKSMGTFNGSETTRILSLGEFKAGDEAVLEIKLTGDVLYVKKGSGAEKYYDALYYIDMDVFEDSMSTLAEHQLKVDADWSEDDIKGTLSTANDNQMIMTTIPYDEGWKVIVDGKSVETFETLDAVVAFRIENAGDHTVRLLYRPVCFTLGITISILSLAIFILIIIFEKPLTAMLRKLGNQFEDNGIDDYSDDWLPNNEDTIKRNEEVNRFAAENKPENSATDTGADSDTEE